MPKMPSWRKQYENSTLIVLGQDRDGEPFNLADVERWENEGRARRLLQDLTEAEVDAFLEWYTYSDPVNNEEKVEGAVVRAMLIDYLRYKLGFPTHIPESQRLSNDAISAIEQVLTVNQDVYDLLKKRGVPPGDIHVLCRMARGEDV